jgi:signal transduction histidine kinase
VISILELLKDSYTEYDKPAVNRFIKMATNSAYGTLTLLDNLLAWTSAKNKAMNFNPVKVNLHELVLGQIDNLFISASHKLISLEYSIPFELCLKADQQMVEVIFRNLIQNAIKYSYVGGEITVGAIVNEKFVEITVQDYGIGITDKAREELFTDSSNKSTKGTNNEYGNGLGLLLCKEFVEKHGGSIGIESEQGKGSKVRFSLPHCN